MIKCSIYQINVARDDYGCLFRDYAFMQRALEQNEPDSEIYDRVFTGEIEGYTLEDVFAVFNWDYPDGYEGRSLSVSDVVEVMEGPEVEPGFYFCDNIGFKRVEFDATRVPDFEPEITVVLLEPGKMARIAQIDSSLEGLQKTVGGYIEAVYPFEDEACIVCNEEGKLMGLPLNRAIWMDGQMTDIIAGTCFVCNTEKANFGSLSKKQQAEYMKMFQYPEHFMRINNEIVALPYKPEQSREER